MADYSDPKRGVAYRMTLSLFARSDNQIKTTPTLAAGDVKVSKDNGATANITTLPAETPASSGILQVDLSGTEMTADLVTVIFRDASGAEWNDVAVNIAPSPVQMGDLATAANLAIVDTVVDDILADTVDIQSRLPAALVSGRIDASVGAMTANVVTAAAIAADAITAAKIAADAIGASELAADAVTEISAGVWDRLTSALTTVGSAGKLVVDNLNATVGSRATQTSVDALAGYVDTEVAAIKVKTDSLTFTVAGHVDANVQYVNDVVVTGTGAPGNEWGP